jgi:hypothetical protein
MVDGLGLRANQDKAAFGNIGRKRQVLLQRPIKMLLARDVVKPIDKHDCLASGLQVSVANPVHMQGKSIFGLLKVRDAMGTPDVRLPAIEHADQITVERKSIAPFERIALTGRKEGKVRCAEKLGWNAPACYRRFSGASRTNHCNIAAIMVLY